MKNALYLDAITQDFLDNFQQDYDVELIGIESDEKDFIETVDTWNGIQVGGSTYNIYRLGFSATGFKWHHPSGTIISGMFSTPVEAFEYVLNEVPDELDSDDFTQEIRAAIVAKCGRISGLADYGLI